MTKCKAWLAGVLLMGAAGLLRLSAGAAEPKVEARGGNVSSTLGGPRPSN